MELKKLDETNKNELSMIEVAHAILADRGKTIQFPDLVNAIQEYTGFSDDEIKDKLVQFYTDLNVDGSFISLGNNVWGLRTWYPYESVDEATASEGDDQPKTKKRHKINAFLADASDDDDVIDYENDDPEDDDDVVDYDDDDDDSVDDDDIDYDNDDPEDEEVHDDIDDVELQDDEDDDEDEDDD
ncbi:DNA-directed RNA polymerase subunit delta [Fructilactobacillus cliffordii]|uniref:Probable DNA-directed RNA polymerase subunit delta n=1 Tax=Fructilactobacillus cliffordii TaxID=2940299 RepID=A0A9Q8ZT15_9LACO|nr:DNA-directed RNA polymerase subunit delta [Fructilactobacillus cliffordii]USS87049.1 DNA-directed RNA polymerase subunit delta [Fructilactobacillus cliffordii]USS88772.1 DNA-directed RNA polymerase subunit delta [Fructilactobacillus cliffordii]